MRNILLLLAMLSSSSVYAQEEEGWVYNEDVDDFTDEQTITAVITATGNGQGAFMVSCKVSKSEFMFYIFPPEDFKPQVLAKLPNVEYRFDKRPTQKLSLPVLPIEDTYVYGGNSLHMAFNAEFIIGAEKLIFRFGTPSGKQVVSKFNIADPKGIYKKVLMKCGEGLIK